MPGLYKLRYVAATADSKLYSTQTPHSVQWQTGNSNETCSAYSEVWNWCKEQYGTIGYRWVPRIGAGTYAFYDEKMLALFLLRWPVIVVDKDKSIFGIIYPDSTL